MSEIQFESIEDFAYSYGLGTWKAPVPETFLSWKEINALHYKASKMANIANAYDKEVSNAKNVVHKYQWGKELWEAENNVNEQIMIQCWQFVQSGKKPMRVKIHDWIRDYIFGIAPFSNESDLWYRAIAWEYHHWFYNLKNEYHDKLTKEIGNSHRLLQVASNDFTTWERTYYKQRDLFYYWLHLRGFRLSYDDFHIRLRKHVWGIIPPSYAMEDHTKPY